MKLTAVIMAGGKGERFWPKSRASCPKQFLSLTSDGETMIQKTVRRLHPLVAPEHIYILTNQNYSHLLRQQLPDLPEENIIAEPCPRNTAPCIGLAASIIQKKYQDAVMFVLPSDHLIHAEEMYIHTLRKAADVAMQGENLVTLGITPTYPETGYGYIKYLSGGNQNHIYKVERFVEKPDLQTAASYLKSGGYLWNSGMFIWKASSILAKIQKFMPELYQNLQPIAAAYGTEQFTEVLHRTFCKLPSESIDFGIMEKSDGIYTIPSSFGWDDVGSWLALERINPTDENGNVLDGNILSMTSRNCTVCADKSAEKLIALLGVQDLVIVDTPDALLVCNKNSTQDMKQLLAALKQQKHSAIL